MIWIAIAYSVRFVPESGRFGSVSHWRPLLEPDEEAFVRDPDTQAALEARGYPVCYVGNPMRDGLDCQPDICQRVEAALKATGWDGFCPVIVLLPGSRKDALQSGAVSGDVGDRQVPHGFARCHRIHCAVDRRTICFLKRMV